MPDATSNEKVELKLQEWDDLVTIDTQDMTLSHDDEIQFLSSQNANLAQYLELHPEMAHELMVPRGLKQRLIRRYERFLDGEKPLSTQNGAAQKARWNEEIFDAMLPGRPTVISNLNGSEEPTWRELNAFICCNGVDTFRGEIMAPHYEYRETGERVRVINYQDMKVEVTAKQWHLMWDHVVCNFAYPNSPEDIEFRALHDAWNEISTIPEPWNDWQNPTGQQIAMIGKQLEHRLCSVHVGRPNPYGQSV